MGVTDAQVDRAVLPPREREAAGSASEQRVLRRLGHRRSPVLGAIARRQRGRPKRNHRQGAAEEHAGDDREPPPARRRRPIGERPTTDERDERDRRERGSLRSPRLYDRPRRAADRERDDQPGRDRSSACARREHEEQHDADTACQHRPAASRQTEDEDEERDRRADRPYCSVIGQRAEPERQHGTDRDEDAERVRVADRLLEEVAVEAVDRCAGCRAQRHGDDADHDDRGKETGEERPPPTSVDGDDDRSECDEVQHGTPRLELDVCAGHRPDGRQGAPCGEEAERGKSPARRTGRLPGDSAEDREQRPGAQQDRQGRVGMPVVAAVREPDGEHEDGCQRRSGHLVGPDRGQRAGVGPRRGRRGSTRERLARRCHTVSVSRQLTARSRPAHRRGEPATDSQSRRATRGSPPNAPTPARSP